MTTVTQELPPIDRLPITAQIFHEIEVFGRYLVDKYPDLESLAIVPSFGATQEHYEAAVFFNTQSPAQLMYMGMQLQRAMRFHLDKIRQQLTEFDQMMGALAKRAKEHGPTAPGEPAGADHPATTDAPL